MPAEYHRARYVADPTRQKRASAAYYIRSKDVVKRNSRTQELKKYGLTIETWDTKFAEQGFCCAACLADDPGCKDGWRTDHCHRTGLVRGILCHHCNVALGHLRDRLDRIDALRNYLESYNVASS